MNLNEKQKKAVRTDARFLFLLAGAGTGKTRVITERIRYLIEKGTDPSRILAITFTRKATLEMHERTGERGVRIHTFHQFAYGYLDHDHRLFDETKSPFTREQLLSFSVYKNGLFRGLRPRGFKAYQRHLKRQNLIDYDDILLEFDRLLAEKRVTLALDHIFIDEFQDTNDLQYGVLKRMIGKNTAVFAVGDPDQSIYRFRGARENIILRFVRDYRAKEETLDLNYRSDQAIIAHANRLIAHNVRAFKKSLVAVSTELGSVLSLRYHDPEEEARDLIELIRFLIRQGIKAEEIAVLYRTHARCYELQFEMLKADLLFQEYEETDHAVPEGIQLLTIHRAKGLEFDVVFVIGLEAGLFPSNRENRLSETEEERRLLFVAMTRARHALYLSSTQYDWSGRWQRPSHFLLESAVKPSE
ncbi:MAG: ATP-dependent helicase [Acholeplasmataceae bacterium]